MEAINKNKEEIEKILKGCGCIEWGCLPECLCPYCERTKQERISTSILWCEDEIEFLKGLEWECDYTFYGKPDKIEERKEQLQNHLNWLKQKQEEMK